MLPAISSQKPDELTGWLAQSGEPAYRADQILRWVHKGSISGWSQMRNIPDSLKKKLSSHFSFSSVKLVHKQGGIDTTIKFLWKLSDGQYVESVLIPASPSLYGETSDRHTLCISTQVGCAYGCKFCASGLEGFKRNLNPGEVIDQVLGVEALFKKRISSDRRLITNLVIMGMGEPLANYDNLLDALNVLNSNWSTNIGARKITISTSGLVPQIIKLSDQPKQYRLAISLHGATDEVRNKIMPINRKYSLSKLSDAVEIYQSRKNGSITLEYILIEGINDGIDQVPHLAILSERLRAKVNIIPYNSVEGLGYKRPSITIQERFVRALIDKGVRATLRREKGHDIDAACGQLRLKAEKKLDSGEN